MFHDSMRSSALTNGLHLEIDMYAYFRHTVVCGMISSWRRYDRETLSELPALCEEMTSNIGALPHKKRLMLSFDALF